MAEAVAKAEAAAATEAAAASEAAAEAAAESPSIIYAESVPASVEEAATEVLEEVVSGFVKGVVKDAVRDVSAAAAGAAAAGLVPAPSFDSMSPGERLCVAAARGFVPHLNELVRQLTGPRVAQVMITAFRLSFKYTHWDATLWLVEFSSFVQADEPSVKECFCLAASLGNNEALKTMMTYCKFLATHDAALRDALQCAVRNKHYCTVEWMQQNCSRLNENKEILKPAIWDACVTNQEDVAANLLRPSPLMQDTEYLSDLLEKVLDKGRWDLMKFIVEFTVIRDDMTMLLLALADTRAKHVRGMENFILMMGGPALKEEDKRRRSVQRLAKLRERERREVFRQRLELERVMQEERESHDRLVEQEINAAVEERRQQLLLQQRAALARANGVRRCCKACVLM